MQVALTALTFTAAWRVWTTDEFSKSKRPSGQVAASERSAPPAAASPATDARVTRDVATALPAPRAQGTTQVAFDLTVDARGHFVPTPEARRLFDSFLVATHEEPERTARGRIVAEIERRLKPPASDEAQALLAAYLSYRSAARDLALHPDAPQGRRARLAKLGELQRAILGERAAEAFFSDNEATHALTTSEATMDRMAGLDE